MLERLCGRKLIVLYISMALIGFFIGYDYAVVTTKQINKEVINKSSAAEKMETTQNMVTTVEDKELEEIEIEEELNEYE